MDPLEGRLVVKLDGHELVDVEGCNGPSVHGQLSSHEHEDPLGTITFGRTHNQVHVRQVQMTSRAHGQVAGYIDGDVGPLLIVRNLPSVQMILRAGGSGYGDQRNGKNNH